MSQIPLEYFLYGEHAGVAAERYVSTSKSHLQMIVDFLCVTKAFLEIIAFRTASLSVGLRPIFHREQGVPAASTAVPHTSSNLTIDWRADPSSWVV